MILIVSCASMVIIEHVHVFQLFGSMYMYVLILMKGSVHGSEKE